MSVFRLNDVQVNLLLRILEKELSLIESKKYISFQDRSNYKIYIQIFNKLSDIDYNSNILL